MMFKPQCYFSEFDYHKFYPAEAFAWVRAPHQQDQVLICKYELDCYLDRADEGLSPEPAELVFL